MRKVSNSAIDDEKLFDDVAAAKYRPTKPALISARADVLAAYNLYVAATPNVSNLTPISLPEAQKAALRHAYDVDTKPLVAALEIIRGKQDVTNCPFCGMSESATIDHYLPKEIYPEFSILSKNLVPSCGWCNNIKSTKITIKGTSIRKFLHPYFDEIPTSNFLRVATKIQQDSLVVRYFLAQPNDMEDEAFSHLNAHFNELGLADRYRRQGLERLGGQYLALVNAYGTSKNAQNVGQNLLESADTAEYQSGPNDWLAALYRAVAGNKDFCDGGFEIVNPRK